MQWLSELALMAESFQIVPGIKARHFAGCVTFAIPELNLLTVRKEDERVLAMFRFDSVGVVSCLAFASDFVARSVLGFNDRQWLAIRT